MKVGDVRMALETVRDMKLAGCLPSATIYNVIMHGLDQAGQMDRAASIIDEMALPGVHPNERSYTTLMEGYACTG
ncbi:hypothetical protein M758_UG147500 [Ceratodon purpureus]|nr:hypothetical protein M758_UG147500 [Ceratodon purpureus]